MIIPYSQHCVTRLPNFFICLVQLCIKKQEKGMSPEELEVVIGGLAEEIEVERSRIDDAANRIRLQPFGFDRYNRLYWQLPSWNNALLIEAPESCSINNPALTYRYSLV